MRPAAIRLIAAHLLNEYRIGGYLLDKSDNGPATFFDVCLFREVQFVRMRRAHPANVGPTFKKDLRFQRHREKADKICLGLAEPPARRVLG
jgi:hypothetical protein